MKYVKGYYMPDEPAPNKEKRERVWPEESVESAMYYQLAYRCGVEPEDVFNTGAIGCRKDADGGVTLLV